MRRQASTTISLVVLASMGCLDFASAATTYSVRDLGTPPGVPSGSWFTPTGINAAGQVSGHAWSLNPQNLGFVWSPAGGGSYAGVPSGQGAPTWNFAYAINDAGQSAGGGYLNPAFIWNTGSNAVTPLPDVNGPNGSEGVSAHGINASGSVVGYGWDFAGGTGYRSFLWKPDSPNGSTGTLVPLGGPSTTLESINDQGQLVGHAPSGGVLWQPTAPNATTGGFFPISPPSGFNSAFPSALNNSGAVVGSTSTGVPNNGHALRWTPSIANGTTGSSIDLGTLPGFTQSQANDVNSFGMIVGSIGNGARAFVWTSGDLMLDLNSLLDASGGGWTLQSATSLNDAGLIVGTGQFDPDGPGGAAAVTRAFLLTPAPEPACLTGIIVTGAIAVARRTRRG